MEAGERSGRERDVDVEIMAREAAGGQLHQGNHPWGRWRYGEEAKEMASLSNEKDLTRCTSQLHTNHTSLHILSRMFIESSYAAALKHCTLVRSRSRPPLLDPGAVHPQRIVNPLVLAFTLVTRNPCACLGSHSVPPCSLTLPSH